MSDFLTFLDSKPLYYEEIDLTRMPRAHSIVQEHFKLDESKIIHIIGTNGKGTTGRFLATALCSSGFSVGHYTSPHILAFNERIWLNGENVNNALLQSAHEKLQKILPSTLSDALSYFEYTTFLAILIFKECDYIVLEAGLGGEYDATSVFQNNLTLFTKIDFDHESFLGNTIEAIATTKCNAMQKYAILGKQQHTEVADILKKIAYKKNIPSKQYFTLVDKKRVETIAKRLHLVEYMQDNLALAMAALKVLEIDYSDGSFDNADFFGRFMPIEKNIIVDVGHNILAAQAIKSALNGEKRVLIYNSYKDKNYKEILTILRDSIAYVAIIDVKEERIVQKELLEHTLEDLSLEYCDFKRIKSDENYLVFGSFSVVETFLRFYNAQ